MHRDATLYAGFCFTFNPSINRVRMLQLIIIVSVAVGFSILLLGIGIFVFGRQFPETEVGKNSNMIKLGLRCPQCEERKRYRKLKPVRIHLKTLQPDWNQLKR
jgi:hypothetical protein